MTTQTQTAGSFGECGFTLVELMVSLVLLGLLTIGLGSALRFGVKAWEASSGYVATSQQAARTEGVLRQAIENAYPLFEAKDITHPHIAFEGSTNRLTLLASSHLTSGEAGNDRVSFETIKHDDGKDFVMTSAPELITASSALPKQTLLKHVKTVTFSYFGNTKLDEKPTWRKAWTGGTWLPKLVRITAEFEDQRPPLDLTVAPQLSADSGCIFDPLTKYCQGR